MADSQNFIDIVKSIWLTSVPYLSGTADVISIIGFVLTFLVLLSVNRIKTDFLHLIRLPALSKQLAGHTSAISDKMHTFPATKNDILKELSLAIVTVEHLRKKTKGIAVLKTLNKELLKHKDNGNISVDQVWSIYRKMLEAGQNISLLLEDKKWRR